MAGMSPTGRRSREGSQDFGNRGRESFASGGFEPRQMESQRSFSHDKHHHHLANIQQWIHHKEEEFARWLVGKHGQERTAKEDELQEMTTIIRTYRGLHEEDAPDADKPWVDRTSSNLAICILILMNGVLIGLEVDLSDDKGIDRHLAWIVLEVVFCLAFLAEVGLKVRVHTWKWILHSFWNFVATVAALFLLLDLGLSTLGVFTQLRLFSLLRFGSFPRLTRKIIKRFSFLDGLRAVLQGFTTSTLAITWTVIQMLIFIYICAVLLTYQIGHNSEVYDSYRKWSGGWSNEEFFGTVGRSMYTLLQFALLDAWSSQVARHILDNQPLMAPVFIIFIILITFGVMNIVVSVIVEHMLELADQGAKRGKHQEEMDRKNELLIIEDIFQHADRDHSGHITMTEFMEACKEPEVAWEMRQLELPVNDAAKLFSIIDGSGSRALSMKEFITGCTQLKGPAQSKNLLGIQAQADSLATKMDALEESLDESERMVILLDELTQRTSRRFEPAVEGTKRKIARAVAGTKPMVPPKREMPSTNLEHEPLSLGNRPALPLFPPLLR